MYENKRKCIMFEFCAPGGRNIFQYFPKRRQSENVFCVKYARYSSVTAQQHPIRRKNGKEPPCKQIILWWYRQFRETHCLCKGKRTENSNQKCQMKQWSEEGIVSCLVHANQRAKEVAKWKYCIKLCGRFSDDGYIFNHSEYRFCNS